MSGVVSLVWQYHSQLIGWKDSSAKYYVSTVTVFTDSGLLNGFVLVFSKAKLTNFVSL